VPDFTVEFVNSRDQMDEALDIRRRVFVEEQGVPEDIEIDEDDEPDAWGRSAIHALLRREGEAVATGRLLLDHGPAQYAHIGRVAVLAAHRNTGAGKELMEALQIRARELGYPGITLAAQLHALGFYEKLGYVLRGDVFLDAGIEHRWMDLKLD
jgi:predicted GNAT family N-acyltransferase